MSSSYSSTASSDYESDPDYDPNSSDDSDSGSGDDDDSFIDDDEDEDEEMPPHAIQMVFTGAPTVVINHGHYHDEEGGDCEDEADNEDEDDSRKRRRSDEPQYTREERAYLKGLSGDALNAIVASEKRVKLARQHSIVPMRFKILGSDMDARTQALVLAKLEQFQRMHEGSGEYFKLRNWLESACRLPLGRYHELPIKSDDSVARVAEYLRGVRASLDKTVFGHVEAKDQIMRILAQWIANPSANGHCIGIHGDMGVGKTSLVKNGLCKALEMPFGFIALGGAADGAFLEGHGFTYEGSTFGKIAEVLMKTQVMNPILYFDELDKVSQTRRGDEIIGILTHLTDSSQNERFNDRFFGEVDINLSRSLIVFSYNDESLINPILKDRMVTIHVNGYGTKEKLCIAKDYLIPDILSQYKLTKTDIVFTDDILEKIIARVPSESGVRNLKRGIESIVGWINMQRFMGDDCEFPLTVTHEHIEKYVKCNDGDGMRRDVMHSMYI